LRKVLFFILFFLVFASGITLENSGFRQSFFYKDANEFLKRKLERKAEVQDHILNHPDLVAMLEHFDVQSDLYSEIQANKLAVFAYKHKCLTFWSDNLIHPFNFPIPKNFNRQLLHNENGWFQVVSIRKGDYDIYCFYQFYHQFPFNNDYFVNHFAEDINLKKVSLIDAGAQLKKDLSGYESHNALPLVDQTSYNERKLSQAFEYLYILAFVLFLVFASVQSYTQSTFNIRRFIIYIASYISVFNILAFTNVILKHKSSIPLFSPELAAFNELIPSLGHAVLILMAILCALIVMHQLLSAAKPIYLNKTVFVVLASAVFWSLTYYLFLSVLPTYILNSQINYDFKSFANITQYTMIGMFNVFLLFMILVVVSRILAGIGRHHIDFNQFLKIHLIVCAILVSWAYFIEKDNGFLLICLSLFGVLWSFFMLFPVRLQFRHILAFALVSSAFLSVQFEQLNSFKEKEHRKLFASKLIAKEDIDNDIKLLNVEKEMINSAAIDSFFYYANNDYEEVELNYKFTFFNEFIKNFDIDIMRYDSLGNDITPNKLNYNYVNSLYNSSTNKSITNYFLYIKDLHYLGGYLAKYEICPGKRNLGYVFLMLIPKVKSDLYNLDYFFSRMDYNHLTENAYSYAIYQKNELIKGLGAYPFKLSDNIRYQSMEDVSFFEQNGYSQLFKKIDDETFIIVSLKAATWNKKFTVFTFLLLYFTGLLVVFYALMYVLIFILSVLTFSPFFLKLYGVVTRYFRVININKLYLETKIRLSFLLISILICSVVIYFTVQNVNRSFKEKQNDNLDKKMSQILTELEMGFQKKDQRPIQNLIKHLAGNHEVDINIYSKDGTLYQTANNRIYFEGWFSPYMHPDAHYELIHNKQYSIKQVEKIGDLEYQSYYSSLFDENRNLIGYVHLPYFSKSLDLKNEFSNYLGSLLNISTLLLMISLLIASYIGRSLVRPLKLMIENLARIKVGEQNTAIAWSRNDEIGQLVDQYNIMLKKLEVSTELLAQSEREGAWKEMAKQVAHEIKNPLTPMKLHLQHLQMSINRDDDNLKEKVSNISRILIEQIDQLSRMAEEFSSFAKMPMAVLETCNIKEVLESCIILFRAQNDLEIDFETELDEVMVHIDKGQMQRVFTNILKNAYQASRENEACMIKVRLKRVDHQVEISFEDNGKGIEEELKDKIFHPSFSTKNSGMGLGLAICRKIVEQVHGQITFVSDTNKGTTFFVVIPIAPTESSNI